MTDSSKLTILKTVEPPRGTWVLREVQLDQKGIDLFIGPPKIIDFSLLSDDTKAKADTFSFDEVSSTLLINGMTYKVFTLHAKCVALSLKNRNYLYAPLQANSDYRQEAPTIQSLEKSLSNKQWKLPSEVIGSRFLFLEQKLISKSPMSLGYKVLHMISNEGTQYGRWQIEIVNDIPLLKIKHSKGGKDIIFPIIEAGKQQVKILHWNEQKKQDETILLSLEEDVIRP